MQGWPAILEVAGKRCVVVGGGPVALRRAASLIAAGADVTLIAPDGATLERAHIQRRAYASGDVTGAAVVVAATNDAATNAAVVRDARAAGAWVNRTDAPADGDLSVPAVATAGPVRVAVDTGGISAAAARALADHLAAAVDADWQVLLEEAEPYRGKVQAAFHDPRARHAALRRLTDQQAMTALRERGPEGLRSHYDAVLENAPR